MPLSIRTNTKARASTANLSSKNHSYDYPLKLNLKPGSKTHDFIRDQVLDRAQDSRAALSGRFQSWKTIDKSLTAYIDLTDEETSLQDADENKAISIVVPVTYATLEVLLTYLVMAFRSLMV